MAWLRVIRNNQKSIRLMKSNEEPHKEDIAEEKLSPFGKLLAKIKRKYLSDLEVVLFGKNRLFKSFMFENFDNFSF